MYGWCVYCIVSVLLVHQSSREKIQPIEQIQFGFYLNLFVAVYFHCLATYLRRNIFLPCLFYLFIIIICYAPKSRPSSSSFSEIFVAPSLSQCTAKASQIALMVLNVRSHSPSGYFIETASSKYTTRQLQFFQSFAFFFGDTRILSNDILAVKAFFGNNMREKKTDETRLSTLMMYVNL